MQRYLWISLITLAMITCFHTTTGQEKKADTIVAIVNDDIVTYGEVYNQIKESIAKIEESVTYSMREKELKKGELFKIGLQRIVDQRLTVQEAKKYNIKVSEETIQQQLQKELAAHQGKPMGIADVDLSEIIRHQLTLRELFHKKTGYSREEKRRPAIDPYVSPQEMRRYYKNNIAQYTEKPKIKIQIITLFYNQNGGKEKTIEMARGLVTELRNEKADFSAIARAVSNDTYASMCGTYPRVKKYLFNITEEDATELNKKWMDEQIRNQFEEHKIDLSENIKVEKKNEQWQIVDRDHKYSIIPVQNEWRVYEEDQWDFIAKGDALYNPVEDIAFALAPGEISDPILVDNNNSCQILKVIDAKPGGIRQFIEVQEEIRQILRYQKIMKEFDRMTSMLRQNAFIWPPNLFEEK